ncbi:hypothetical protein V8E52_011004 [Russula decolorans]
MIFKLFTIQAFIALVLLASSSTSSVNAAPAPLDYEQEIHPAVPTTATNEKRFAEPIANNNGLCEVEKLFEGVGSACQ